ncbi:translocation/assembly module TamB domain-containing protein [Oceanicola sp. S124]|uniref:translocation/assembly module TamB domain-containing protein n=1 Tax=Oceanicola sp. S124 TaxID=1042378 RepID=UPI0002557D4F|nr:translocation/assembly module TamB domain-containing protein [Oceanicola sp. S124]
MHIPRLLPLVACGLLALTPAAAQQSPAADDDGEGFLTRTLQNALSSDGMEVDITGFQGALSSSARMERLTIADENGIWLDLRNAELNWNRSALLRGRLDVTTLSAESITLERLPEGEEKAPSPEASGFSIPELPVAVEIGELRIGRFEMGEAVVGEAASLSLEGRASLADGGLDTNLNIDRLDREGHISILAAFDPEAESLSVDISASEPQGGLVANLLDLPGAPAVELTARGAGPLDSYDASLLLATDGEERLSGDVSLRGRDDGGREFTADLGGDLTALMAPDYRDFLGTDIGLTATGTAGADGALDVQLFRLRSASVNLEGRLALDGDGAPQSFDLSGLLAAPDGSERLTLPMGEGISLASGRVSASFDRSQSTEMTARIEALAAAMPGFSSEELALDVTGPLRKARASQLTLGLTARGLSAEDPAVAEALGQTLTGSAEVTFGDGPIAIENLRLAGPALTLSGAASYEGTGDQAGFALQAHTEVADLTAFAPLTGLDLAGSAELDLAAQMQLPAGTGRITASGLGENLSTGIAQADALLASPAELKLDVTRDETGITLNTLTLGTREMRLTGAGRLGSEDGSIGYKLALADANLLTGAAGAPAPFAVTGQITQTPTEMTLTAEGGGERLALGIEALDDLLATGLSVNAQATLPKEGAPRIDRAVLANEALRLSVNGALPGAESDMALDLSAWLANSGTFTGATGGPLELTGRVSGQPDALSASLSGGGEDLRTGIAAVDALLDGRTSLSLDAGLQGEVVTLSRLDLNAPGLTARASGEVGAQTALQIDARLPDSGKPFGASAGPLSLAAKVTGDGPSYVIEAEARGQSIGIGNPQLDALFAGDSSVTAALRLTGDGVLQIDSAALNSTALEASASGQVAGSDVTLDLSARLDNLARLADGFSGPLTVSGSVSPGQNGALAVDATASGPGGSDARLTGEVARADGSMAISLNGSAPLGLANPFIAPRSAAGLARFDLSLSGQPALSALSGQVTLENGRLVAPSLGQVIDGISGNVQLAGGTARLNLQARPSEGGSLRISGPVALEAPYRAGLDLALDRVIFTQAGLATTVLDGALQITGPLTGNGQIAGRIGLTDTEIRVPSGGFGGQEAIPEMRHIAEPAASRATRARAGLTGEDNGSSAVTGSGGSDGGLGLDVQVVTDSSVFIRGRGLDAELRGSLDIGGTTGAPRPVGQFDLVRGRLAILTKRLELSEGQLRLAGSFEPLLHFVATSQSGSYLYSIAIDGTAAAPEIDFTSNPGLPEDEILSQLFFDKPLSQLSAIQAAQLAAAVATLTGKGGGGVLEKLRASTGLDNLDVATDADGQASVTAGKYLNENLYTETEITGEGETNLSINLDLTDNIRAKGSVDSGGGTGIGVFFEKDY